MQNNSVIVPENRNQFNSFSCFSSQIQIYMSVLTERAVYGAGAGWEWNALKSLQWNLMQHCKQHFNSQMKPLMLLIVSLA